MNITEWVNQVINGPGGMNEFEAHEMVMWNDTERVSAAIWVLRCLANPACYGSEEVLQAIQERRAELRQRDQEKLAAWEANRT